MIIQFFKSIGFEVWSAIEVEHMNYSLLVPLCPSRASLRFLPALRSFILDAERRYAMRASHLCTARAVQASKPTRLVTS